MYLHDGIPGTGLLIQNANAVHHCLGHCIPPRVATPACLSEKGDDAPPLARRAKPGRLLRVEELSPPLGEIVVLVHQRIPNCNFGVTVPVGAACSNVALFYDDGTEWIRQVSRCRLAFVPIVP